MTLRLPTTVEACLFDLDGVLTDTAAVHAAAWKKMFDAFLRERQGRFVPFDVVADYAAYVDGKERNDGVRSFLTARAITLPDGMPDDPPSSDTVHGLGHRKNAIVLSLLQRDGVTVFADAVHFVDAVRDVGIATAVVSSSTNCADVLAAAHIDDRFDARIDAHVARQQGLRGKPAPDMFIAAARALGVAVEDAAVFEDALVGVEAGHAGGFVPVVGVARVVPAERLLEHGADVVVRELTELLEAA